MKTCTTCLVEKHINEFNVKNSSPDGRTTRCRQCSKKAAELYRKQNKEKLKSAQKIYREQNKDKLKERKKVDYCKRRDHIKTKNAEWYEKNKDIVSEKYKKRYAENSDVIKERVKKYRLANPDKIKEDQIKHREKNKDKAKLYSATWRKKNKTVIKMYRRNRRALVKSSSGKLSLGLAEKLYKLQKGKCACCNLPLGDDYHMDHIMPLALGGKNTDDNIQLLRARCNLQKKAKHPVDFMQERGYLL